MKSRWLAGPNISLAVNVSDVERDGLYRGAVTPPSVLQCELAAVGYRGISLDRLDGSNAYLAIFAPPSIASRMRPEAMVPCKTSRAI